MNDAGVTLETLAASSGEEQIRRYQEARNCVESTKPAHISTPEEAKTLLEWWESERRADEEKAAKKKPKKKKSNGAVKHTNPILAEAAALAARQLEARKAREVEARKAREAK